MAPLNRIIIDTDPGIDDVLAILLALSAKSEELEIVLISVTFGNVEVRSCLRNVVAIFQILEKELQWRRENGKLEGFEGMTKYKPIVAVGANEPLHEQLLMADYFHGPDGLAGIHESHPHLSPEDTWQKLFEKPPPDSVVTEGVDDRELTEDQSSFRPSLVPAHKEILRVLKENEPDTITIVAVGPLTNLALAAAEDTETFLRVKEVVSMGGAIDLNGNVCFPPSNPSSLTLFQITPVGEFNVFADSVAAARIYALTSPNPSSTMPPTPTHVDPESILPPYPATLSRPLKLTLFPLDLTELHILPRGFFNSLTSPLLTPSTFPPSPLATWMTAFMTPMFAKMERLHENQSGDSASLSLHDPLCIWYVLTRNSPAWIRSPQSPEDIRVDTTGQWTRGMTVVDRRTRKRRESDGVRPHDQGNWLGSKSGNRVDRMVGSPGEYAFARYMLERVLGLGLGTK
jgi:inosine-uridine nucleoside N-ribohydrolase